MMSPQEYENQSKTSRQINFLLTKAVDLINKMTSKKKLPDTEGMDAALMAEVVKKATVRIPVKFSLPLQPLMLRPSPQYPVLSFLKSSY